MPTDSTFETHLMPVSSLRGVSVLVLTGLSILLEIVSLKTDNLSLNPDDFRYAEATGIMGLICIFVAFCLQGSCEDFALDKKKRRYRTFNSLWGIRVGAWQQLPAVAGVIVKYFSAHTTPTGNGKYGWGTWTSGAAQQFYIVMLSISDSQQGVIVHKFSYVQKQQALQLATELAAYLAVPLQTFEGRA